MLADGGDSVVRPSLQNCIDEFLVLARHHHGLPRQVAIALRVIEQPHADVHHPLRSAAGKDLQVKFAVQRIVRLILDRRLFRLVARHLRKPVIGEQHPLLPCGVAVTQRFVHGRFGAPVPCARQIVETLLADRRAALGHAGGDGRRGLRLYQGRFGARQQRRADRRYRELLALETHAALWCRVVVDELRRGPVPDDGRQHHAWLMADARPWT